MNEVELGDTAIDTISGFKGLVTQKNFRLYGNVQVYIAPRELNQGSPIDGHWFDVGQVKALQEPPKIAGFIRTLQPPP